MQQVDARCPQALKSPAEDEVRIPDACSRRNSTVSVAAHRKRSGRATLAVLIDTHRRSLAVHGVSARCGFSGGKLAASGLARAAHHGAPSHPASLVFSWTRANSLSLRGCVLVCSDRHTLHSLMLSIARSLSLSLPISGVSMFACAQILAVPKKIRLS